MDAKIVAAIVSGLFVLISPILTLFIKKYIDDLQILPISAGRRCALKGFWKGTIKQEQKLNDTSLNFPANIEITTKGKRIFGVLNIQFEWNGENRNVSFDCKGGFYFNDFLQLNYLPNNSPTRQFGSMILMLDSIGDRLEGRIIGYGIRTRKIVSGTIIFEKIQ